MGKSSGGIRGSGRSAGGNSDITRYSYEYNGSTYTHKIEKNEFGVDRVFRYRDGVREDRSFDIADFRNNIAFNKKTVVKPKAEKLPKFQDSGATYDLNKIKKFVINDMKKRPGFKFVKFEKNYAGTYDLIYDSPRSKNIRMSWSDLKRGLK